jgi:hypothetical protein
MRGVEGCGIDVIIVGVTEIGVVSFVDLDISVVKDTAFIIVTDEVPGGLRFLAEVRPYMPWHARTSFAARIRRLGRAWGTARL